MDNVLIDSLASPSRSKFYAALPKLRNIHHGSREQFIVQALLALSAAIGIPEREKSARVQALGEQGLTIKASAKLLDAAPHFSPGVRNALAHILPSTRRALLLSAPPPLNKELSKTPIEHNEGHSSPLQASKSAATEFDNSDSALDGTVLLLSRAPTQEGNTNLLKRNGFGAIVYREWQAAKTDLENNPDVCGCAIDGSFLSDLEASQQCALLEEVGGYSSFFWIRIDSAGLKISVTAARETIRSAQCSIGSLSAERVSFQPDGILRENELADVIHARGFLSIASSVKFRPKDLNDESEYLLIRSLKSHTDSRRLHPLELSSVEVQFLTHGMSGAKVALVRPNSDGRGVVAKVHERAFVVEEMRRFEAFIRTWDDELNPQVFVHGRNAIIFFDIIAREGDHASPADMLDQCLRDLWISELHRPEGEASAVSHRAENLAAGVQLLATKLGVLNRRPSGNTEFSPRGYPDPDYIARVEARGFDWGLDRAAVQARAHAKEVFDRLKVAAVVHGDLHLQNILMRGDRDPHVIDYANSGPGHPAVDLVRLELALFCKHLKCLGRSDDFVTLQRTMSTQACSLSDLKRDYSSLFCSELNRVCLTGCIAARDAALQAVAQFGGGLSDYVAAKYLVAWQSLLLDDRQPNLVRSTIQGLAPMLATL